MLTNQQWPSGAEQHLLVNASSSIAHSMLTGRQVKRQLLCVSLYTLQASKLHLPGQSSACQNDVYVRSCQLRRDVYML